MIEQKAGYQPGVGRLDVTNLPQGGSGVPPYPPEALARQGKLVNDIRITQFIALNEGLLRHILTELVGIREELAEINRDLAEMQSAKVML